MMRATSPAAMFACGFLFVIVAAGGCGCTSSTTTSDVDFKLGDLIEPFTPPTLAELDAIAKWEDQPVVDAMAVARAEQKSTTAPVTVDEALALKNDSPEANEKILKTLGRLAESDDEANWDATLNRHVPGDVKSSNPLLASSTTEFEVNSLLGFGLFGFDASFKPFASSDAVVSWQTSADRMYDKVVMRKDLTWSDGKPITAHDIVFSFQLIMSEAVPVPAQRSGTDKIKWIEAYDDHTLVIFHKESLPTNVWNINFSVVPKHVYEKSVYEDPSLQDSDYHRSFENNPVTGGAYEVVKRVPLQQIVVKRRDSYYMHEGKQVREKPYFETVRFNVINDPSKALLTLKAGDVDEMILTPQQWTTETIGPDFYRNNTKAYGVEWVYFFFGWNNKSKFFSDARVRKAMSYAFDHEELIKKLRFGIDEPCNGIFHPNSMWSPKENAPKPYQRDPEQTRKLLTEAGWTDSNEDGVLDKEIGGKRVNFEFSILVSNRADRIDICRLLAQNLQQFGIVCNVKPLEPTVLQQKCLEHEFEAYFGGWGTGTDPDTSENLWATDKERNFVQYSNPTIDKLFEEGRREFDLEKRQKIYAQIHQLIYDDQPYTFLYFQNAFYGFNKSLRGYQFSPRGPYSYSPGFSSIYKPAMQ